MKFKCEKKDIIDIIASASRILPTKGLKPEESCMLISANNKGVQFEYTDTVIRMRSTCPATIETEGKCMLPAHTLRNVLSTYDSGEVEFELDNSALWMRSGKSKSKFQTIDPKLFPGADVEEKTKGELKISQKVLKEMFEATNYAVATDNSKPVLTGISITLKEGKIDVMAVDGYRLSLMSENAEISIEGQYVIPIKAVREIMHHLKDEGDVVIKIPEENIVTFELEQISLSCGLLQGSPLDPTKIFPEDKETAIKVKCDEFLASVGRAAIFAGSKPVKLSIEDNLTGKFLRVQSECETGACDEEIAIEMTGKTLDIKFNPKYLMDALKHINRDECIIEFKDANKPCVFCADEKASKHLVLPCSA